MRKKSRPSISDLLLLSIFLAPLGSSLPPPPFGSGIVLIGDAKFSGDGRSIRLTDPQPSSPSSSGLLIQKKPIRLFASDAKSKKKKPISFSADFTFSVSPRAGGGLAFLLLPENSLSKLLPSPSNDSVGFGIPRGARFFEVEFGTSVDGRNLGDLNGNHVSIHVGSPVAVETSNVSSIGLVLNSGLKLHSRIDYDATSKRFEIRLSSFSDRRPYDPLLVYRIDLLRTWGDEDPVYAGLRSSSNGGGDSWQFSSVYSWSFTTRTVPRWLHSQPVNVMAAPPPSEICSSSEFLSELIFVAGCIALFIVALVAVTVWSVSGSGTVLTIPAEFGGDPRGYEKIDVVLGDGGDNHGDDDDDDDDDDE